jgi:hypothetical protein
MPLFGSYNADIDGKDTLKLAGLFGLLNFSESGPKIDYSVGQYS